MKLLGTSFLKRLLDDQQGQSVVLIATVFTALMGLSSMAIETGHVYYAYRMLVASTNEATLAAAQSMPNIGTSSDSMTAGTAWANVHRYSSIPGAENATSVLQETSTSISASFYCSSDASSLNVICQSPASPAGSSSSPGSCSGSASSCNAVQVTQTAKVSLWFGGLVGFHTFNLSASSSASMRGGTNIPYNIAVIIDTTNSMSSCGGGGGHGTTTCTKDCPNGANSQIACAVSGLEPMLENMDPCALNTNCTTTSTYVDSVSLFVFPALAAGNTSKDTVCPTKDPNIVPYAFPNVTAGGTQNLILPTSTTLYPNNAGTYQVVAWDNGYKANDGASTLNTSDSLGLPIAVGAGSCQGLQAPGGEGTYYAQAILAAQAALAAEQTAHTGSQNVLIILSDGDADAGNSNAYTNDGGNNGSGNQIVALSGTLNGTCTTFKSGCSNTNYATTTYPSALGQCGQAVWAAQQATQAGTTVYTVAMGSETSGGCATDQNVTTSATATYGAEAWPTGGSYPGQPCNAIGSMATNANTFYSDDTNGCVATNNASFTTMAQIFTAIGNGLTEARFIPTGH